MIPKNLIMKDLIWLLDLQFSGSDEDAQANSIFFFMKLALSVAELPLVISCYIMLYHVISNIYIYIHNTSSLLL